ncbi:MAG: hypothetical protein AUG02_07205 [Chloroflexi bacterium 13_1_20CM_2_70_9]|nr:MAG: hypothetical protein AUG02_07205 [Chloroflexi bacterium 13_1_20CM_2_70_9]
MPAPHVELARAAVPNEMGHVVLAFAERVLAPRDLAGLRERLWLGRTYLYVTPGPRLIERALEGFPPEVRALCARCPFHRYDARGGGGFWPDGNEIWLAAGVETYEGLRQVRLSACHELFHFVCWNHPRYRADEGRGFARLRSVVAESRALVDAFPRYRDWVTGSFLRQGDHANVVEYFADIPTNFRDAHQLPPPIAAHFAPLIDGSPFPSEFDTALADGGNDLAAFQRSLAPA